MYTAPSAKMPDASVATISGTTPQYMPDAALSDPFFRFDQHHQGRHFSKSAVGGHGGACRARRRRAFSSGAFDPHRFRFSLFKFPVLSSLVLALYFVPSLSSAHSKQMEGETHAQDHARCSTGAAQAANCRNSSNTGRDPASRL